MAVQSTQIRNRSLLLRFRVNVRDRTTCPTAATELPTATTAYGKLYVATDVGVSQTRTAWMLTPSARPSS